MEGRYCAYLRKSRADALRERMEDGYDALAHHRRALEELAARLGVEVSRWYRDGIKSGDSIAARAEMRELLATVEDGRWDGVLCMEVERLTRGDMGDQAAVGRAFSESGTLIVTPTKVYDPSDEADMEYFEFGLFMSRREYKVIKKRLMAGRVASVKEGQYIFTHRPFGYRKVDVDGMHTLEPVEDEAQAVREMYAARLRGDSYAQIARMLDAMGVAPYKGARWNPGSVHNILHNPVYAGRISFKRGAQTAYVENGRKRTRSTPPTESYLVDGLHEGIVDGATWDAVQAMAYHSPVKRTHITRNYYGRLLKCAECGKSLSYTDSGNCREPLLSHLHRGEGCMTKGCRLPVFDEVFCGALESIAADIEEMVGNDAPDKRRETCETAISAARAAIEANFDRMERGIITEEDFVRRRAVLEGRIAESTAMLESLPPEADELAERAVKLRECVAAIRDPQVDGETKRLLIWALVDRIEYQNRAPVGKDDIRLDIRMR